MSKPMLAGGAATGLLDRPFAETPSSEIEGLFLSAAKPDREWFVGTELELFTHHRSDGRAASHATIRELLEALGVRLQMAPEHEVNGELIGLKGGGVSVSLEPGGQLELATRPHRALKALREEIINWANTLAELGEPRGLGFWALGHQPFVDRDTAPVMPKPRYAIMREHLTGNRGRDMMHLTGSVQVTVDFLNERNLVDKIRTAVRVSPFISALVAASPFSNGKLNGFKTMRYEIWLYTDAARCGVWPEMLDEEGLTARRYIERTLSAPAMFFQRDGGFRAADGQTSFRAYAERGFEDSVVSVADFVDHLTTFFPEIRPKGYVEMRGADCVLPDLTVGLAGFWRGILDDEPTRAAVEERLKSIDFEAMRALQPAVARRGLEASSPAGPVGEVAEWLVKLAHARLLASTPDCAECVEPLVELAESRKSPADRMIEVAEKSGIDAALELVRIR